MKIEIFDEKKEKVLRLRLVDINGNAVLCAVDESGERIHKGSLLRVEAKGVHRFDKVDPGLGLPLNEECRIKLNEGEPE